MLFTRDLIDVSNKRVFRSQELLFENGHSNGRLFILVYGKRDDVDGIEDE